jgi:DnaJ-class molecular chaperone
MSTPPMTPTDAAREPAAATRRTPQCRTCGGTGSIWLSNSWLTADGYSRTKCWVCDGLGVTDFRDHCPEFTRRQADVRSRVRASR